MRKWLPYLLAVLAGSSLTLAYAPFDIWLLTPVALCLALYQLNKQHVSGFKLGWLFGLGWFGAGISWVHVSIADFGGMPLFASVLMMLALCGYLALYPALAFHFLKRYFGVTWWPFALPLVWTSAEWLRSWMLSGFPWLSVGYSQLNGWLNGWFAAIGETGVTALLVGLSASIVASIYTRRYIGSGVAAALAVAGSVGLNQVNWTTPVEDVSVGMVQGNIAQSLRWVPEQDLPTMTRYETLTDLLWDNDIIVWPEAAVPKLELLALEYLQKMDARATEHDTAIITGVVNYNFESEEAWNNLIVMGKKYQQDESGHYYYFHGNRYAKHHLLPVGEFVPFEDLLRPLAPLFDLPMSSFSRGDFQQTNLVANGNHLAPAICFEIAFPRQVAANLYEDTDFIITVSNDAWFGASHGPDQHMQIAQVRAKEFGIPVIRATNNGISALVDHHGDIVARLPQFEAATLSGKLSKVTGYTLYRQWGDSLVWLISLALYLFAVSKRATPREK